MKKLFLFCIAGYLLSSCGKSDSSTVLVAAGNYTPSTTGSSWTYNSNPGGSFTLTATTKDSLINGKTYKVINNSSGANIYFLKSGNDYYRYGLINLPGLTAPEELYLKDNVNVGTSWQISQTQNVSYGGSPITINMIGTYTIEKNDTTLVLGSNTFTNAVKVNLSIKATYAAISFDLGGGSFFYKDGVGLVRYLLSIKGAQLGYTDYSQEVNITGYTIK
jgi:hypothetical protein